MVKSCTRAICAIIWQKHWVQFENLHILQEFQVTVQLLKKIQSTVLLFIPLKLEGVLLSRFVPSMLYVWLSGERARWLPDLFGICWSHWFSSPVPPNVHHTGIPGEERKQPVRHTRPYQGGFIIMISVHFPSLFIMRNESSFGDKEGEWSTGGLLFFFPPLIIVGMRGEMDSKQFTGWGMWVLFWNWAGFFAVRHIRRWWIIEELWAYQLFRIRKWRKHGRMY